jgi:nucleoside-diphosphate-sugar epimerase
MKTALIGYTGFVGSTLSQSLQPSHRYRSTDIDDIRGHEFEHVVCAGVQAMKWWANLHPDKDWDGIDRLLDALREVKCSRFTLISTIDVYPAPQVIDENSLIDRNGHHAYGLHRLMVEDWVRDHFSNVSILRLPGLFGPGLKKNVIYDMLHSNNLDRVHPGGVFQYYDTRCLYQDISRVWDLEIPLLNVSSEPISTQEISDRFFPDKLLTGSGDAPQGYDMRSVYDYQWNGNSGYLYTKEKVLRQLGEWLASIR